MEAEKIQSWDREIKSTKGLLDINLGEIWRYRDLLWLFVRRDFVAMYKQTILGPIWFFIQPLLTTITFTIIFGRLAKISTDSIPPLAFYLAGVTLWNYFADCIVKTSNTFTINANIFGKVYFPRMIVPLSVVVSNLLKLGVQLILFIAVWGYYYSQGSISPTWALVMLPFLILIMAGLGLGSGILISSLTTKYRDLQFLVQFGVQLLMYGSPVVFPYSVAKGTKFEILLQINPVTGVIEAFRYATLGTGELSMSLLAYSVVFMIILLFAGVVSFNKVEKNFMDTV